MYQTSGVHALVRNPNLQRRWVFRAPPTNMVMQRRLAMPPGGVFVAATADHLTPVLAALTSTYRQALKRQ